MQLDDLSVGGRLLDSSIEHAKTLKALCAEVSLKIVCSPHGVEEDSLDRECLRAALNPILGCQNLADELLAAFALGHLTVMGCPFQPLADRADKALRKLDAGIQTYATCDPEVHHLYEQWIKGKVEEGQENLRSLDEEVSCSIAETDSLVTLPAPEQEAAKPVDDTLDEVQTTAPEAPPTAPPLAPEPGGQSIESTEDLQPACGVAPRNQWFLAQYNAKGTDTYHRPKAIQQKWWDMSDGGRTEICPDAPGRVSHDTVVQAIKRTQAKPKRRASKRQA